MPFDGTYTQDMYAQQLIDEYKQAGIPASDVYPQSFQLRDIQFWLGKEPDYGRQAIFLDNRDETAKGFVPENPATWQPGMADLAQKGVRILAPPLWMLVRPGPDGTIEPSTYARAVKRAGLGPVAWSLERSGPLKKGGAYYHPSIKPVVTGDGDLLRQLRRGTVCAGQSAHRATREKRPAIRTLTRRMPAMMRASVMVTSLR